MKSNKLNFLIEYPRFCNRLKDLKDIIFFFPFFHFGGAERVHINILRVFKNESSCFITENSINDFFKKEFEENTHIIPYFELKSKKYEIRYIRAIAKAINKKKSPIVFGCNSPLFYKLIPYLKNHVRIIDLIHAFSYEEPYAAEKISLPVAERIDARIVLGQKTKNDFAELYRENNLPEKLLGRIKIIKNKIDISNDYLPKESWENLKILFVARNSFEKRPHYVTEIAKKCLAERLNISFTFVGDFDKDFTDLQNIEIIGPIDSYEKMQKIYQSHHLILITSFREGFPMVILEGMANGVVPITTNVGEISEVINPENKNGYLIDDPNLILYTSSKNRISDSFISFSEEDPVIEQFFEIIKSLYSNSELLNTYSKNAYESVKKIFSEKQFEENYKAVFSQKESS